MVSHAAGAGPTTSMPRARTRQPAAAGARSWRTWRPRSARQRQTPRTAARGSWLSSTARSVRAGPALSSAEGCRAAGGARLERMCLQALSRAASCALTNVGRMAGSVAVSWATLVCADGEDAVPGRVISLPAPDTIPKPCKGVARVVGGPRVCFGVPHRIRASSCVAGLYWVNREAALRLLDDLAEVGALVRLGARPGRSVRHSCLFNASRASCPVRMYLCAEMRYEVLSRPLLQQVSCIVAWPLSV